MIPMGYDAKQPGMNFIVCLANDFADYASVAITMYGSARTYQHCGPFAYNMRIGAVAGASIDVNSRLFIRYE